MLVYQSVIFFNYWTGHRMDTVFLPSLTLHCNHLRYLCRPWKTSCLQQFLALGGSVRETMITFLGAIYPTQELNQPGVYKFDADSFLECPPPRKWSNQNHSRLVEFSGDSNWLVTLLHRSPKWHYTGLPHQKPGSSSKHREHFPWGSPPSINSRVQKQSHCSIIFDLAVELALD